MSKMLKQKQNKTIADGRAIYMVHKQEDKYSIDAHIIENPFFNCQIATVGGVETVIEDHYFNSPKSEIQEIMLKYFSEIADKIDKNLLLIDIDAEFFVEEYLKKVPIYNHFLYKNSNGNNRVFVLIDTRKL